MADARHTLGSVVAILTLAALYAVGDELRELDDPAARGTRVDAP